MIKETFTIDGAIFVDGIHDPDARWNGWATPAFPIESVRKICGWVESMGNAEDMGGEIPTIDDAGRVWWGDGATRSEIRPQKFTVNGELSPVDYYDVGAYGWIWLEVTAE